MAGFGNCSSSTSNLGLDIVIIKRLEATWEKDTVVQVVHTSHSATVSQAIRHIQ